MDVIKRIKNSGNCYFSRKNYVDAGRKYKKALRYYKWMITTVNVSESSNESMLSIKATLLLNLAAVKLKQKNYREALKLCSEVKFD